jgi:adenylate cyclase
MGQWRCDRCGGENPPATRFCGHCGAPAAVVEPSADLREERRLVTALFADVAGFSPLADRLDPEQLTEVIDPLLNRLAGIVHDYGGTVDKFAGDAVLALFGAPRSHGDDPARALAAALDMHREVGLVADRTPEVDRLELHVGVNTGHAVGRLVGGTAGGDYGVLGDAVVLAQRLESAAPRGQTYVGESTYRLTSGAFEFEELGHLSLKGRRLPVRAWRLTGRRQETGTAPPGPSPLVGRQSELDQLTAQIDVAAGGRLAVSVLSGEPGVGKTRLTQAMRAAAEERGVRWLQAQCVAYGTSLPYGPYLDLVRELLGPDAAEAPAVPDRDRPFLAHLLGAPSPETAALQPDAFQQGLHQAIATLLVDAAQERPVAVVIDDMQWSDASSVALTADVLRLCGAAPVLVHLTVRPEARPTAASLLSAAATERRLLLDLGPLAPESVASIVRSIAGASLPTSAAAAVIERSGGNPFFVEELLRWLPESKSGGGSDGDGLDGLDDLPPTVEGVLAARMDRLSRPAGDALLVGSVIGREVPIAWLAAAATEVDDIDAAVLELLDQGFLSRAGGGDVVAFQHALVQEAAYNRLLRRHRRRLHGRVATVGEELFGAGDAMIGVLARHWSLAEDAARGPDYLLRAAAVARHLFANAEALGHLRRAAELAAAGPDAGRLAEVRLALATLLELTGGHDEAQRLYEQVRDATGDARAWRGLASTLRKRGLYADALAVLAAAQASMSPDADGAPAIALELGRTLLGAGRPGEAVPALEAALTRLGPTQAETGQALLYLARSELQCGRFDAALEHGQRALAILEAHDDMSGLVLARRVLGGVYRHLGLLEEAATTLRLGVELADRVGHVEELGACLINLGMVELRLGRIEEAIDCDRRAITQFERVNLLPGCANGYANLAEKLYHAGRYEEAATECRRALDLAVELDDRLRIADVIRTEATILLARGDADQAATRAEEAAALFAAIEAEPDAADARGLALRARDVARARSEVES